ncbi:MAG: fibronectin type III domain-containing protein, partial [Streptosporangiaceae bacterium]
PAGSGPGGGGGSPPAAPTGLTSTGTTSSSVSLSWTAPGGTVTGYHVDHNGSLASTTSATSATITGLSASTSYSFAVTAYNARVRVAQVRRGHGHHLILGRRRGRGHRQRELRRRALRRHDQQPGAHAQSSGHPGRAQGVQRRVRHRQRLHADLG